MGADLASNIMKDYVLYVKKYMNNRFEHGFVMDDFLEIIGGMDTVLLSWTGNTYVGRKKDADIERYYQDFFVVIYELLMFCDRESKRLSEKETDLAKKVLFQGIVYRYLGKCDSRNYRRKEIVLPEYNDVYVSWSKSERNSYIESKLYGPMTLMKAEIHNDFYGIDIHGFEEWCQEWLGDSSFITRGDEKEVVFPTIKDCVIEVKQL